MKERKSCEQPQRLTVRHKHAIIRRKVSEQLRDKLR